MKLHAPEARGRTIRWAALYDVLVEVLALGRQHDLRRMTVELAHVANGDRILDVGCGTGELTLAARAAAGPMGEAAGIDAAPEMIERARIKARRTGVDVSFKVGLIEKLDFPDDHFDVVLSSLMLHYLPDDLKRTGLAEVRRVLNPRGRFLAVDFEPPSRGMAVAAGRIFFGRRMMRSRVFQVKPMLVEAGFADIEAGPTRYRLISFLRARAGK